MRINLTYYKWYAPSGSNQIFYAREDLERGAEFCKENIFGCVFFSAFGKWGYLAQIKRKSGHNIQTIITFKNSEDAKKALAEWMDSQGCPLLEGERYCPLNLTQ
jgi:hypothetical protein